jgi:LysR family transcriptional regulator for metE and metH
VKRIDTLPSPALDVADLRVALAIAAAGTTARAAVALHLSQPAVSRALLAAESKLGTPLFDRTPRGLVPTAAGAALVADASRLLGELVALERRLRAPAPPPTRLRVVCGCHTAYHWLPSAVVRLRAAMPDLEVTLAVEHTLRPSEALRAGEVDVALVTGGESGDAGVDVRPLFADEVVFVLSPGHPLAERRALSRRDLLDHTLLSTHTPRAEARWFLQKVFGRGRPIARFELLALTEAVVDMARAGLGVAVLSEWVAGPHLGRGDLAVKRLATGALRRPWTLAWRRDARDAALRLHAALVATAPRPCLPTG